MDADALNTLPRSRMDLQTVSLFAASARTLPAQCETQAKWIRKSGYPVACAGINGPKFSIGTTTWDQATDRQSSRDSPNLNPSGSKFHFMFQSGAPLPSWWTINGARKRSKVSYTNLHRWPNMLKYAMLAATLVQHAPIPFVPVLSIATASTCTANEPIQVLKYKAHDTNFQCQLVSSQKQNTRK